MTFARHVAALTAVTLMAVGCGGDDDDTAADSTDDSTAATAAIDATAATTAEAGSGTVATPSGDKVSVAILLPCAINDKSWCEAAHTGVKKLEADGLIDLQIVENAPFDAQGATRVMTGFAEDGVDVIIGHSFDYGAPINELAPKFPDSRFLWQGSCNGFCDVAGDNVIDYGMAMHEPAYLAGILAAGVTTTNKLGTNSGYDIPVCRASIEAFLMGAQEVNPDIERIDTFLGSWVDVAKAKEATAAQAEQGADVFMACGNAGSFGMIQEAKEQNLTAFGYVWDESELATDNVMASMSWQLDVTFGKIVEDFKAGALQPYYEIYMKDGGFKLEVNEQYSVGEVSPDAQAKYEEKLAAIKGGTFEVPFKPTADA